MRCAVSLALSPLLSMTRLAKTTDCRNPRRTSLKSLRAPNRLAAFHCVRTGQLQGAAPKLRSGHRIRQFEVVI